MKAAKILMLIGAVLIIFGMIFQFQGRGQIGPESSFMYYNPDWIYYGIGIIISGIITAGAGILLLLRRH